MNRLGNCTSGCALALAAVFLVSFVGCSKGPTSSTPTTTTTTTTSIPIADAPTITCQSLVTANTLSAAGTRVNFLPPTTDKGEAPVSVACTPQSGSTFPVGESRVDCTATDNRNRTASCSMTVRVTKLASLSKTRYLAFGDSLTAGEVTAPIGAGAAGTIFKQIVVPAAAYPTVLTKSLRAAYFLQEDDISVANYGLGGERAENARDRLILALNTVRPEVLLLQHGTNDIHLGEDGAASKAQSEVSRMVQEARVRGIRVFLANLPPAGPGSRTTLPILITDYNNRMFTVSRNDGAVLVDVFTALNSDVRRYIGVDGLHPNEAGYAKMAETFEIAIRIELEVK